MISFDGNSTDVGGTEPFVEINGNASILVCVILRNVLIRVITEEL